MVSADLGGMASRTSPRLNSSFEENAGPVFKTATAESRRVASDNALLMNPNQPRKENLREELDSTENAQELIRARARVSLLEEKLFTAGTHLKTLATENAQLAQSAEENYARAESLQRELERIRARISDEGGDDFAVEASRRCEERVAILQAEKAAVEKLASDRESALSDWAERLQTQLVDVTQKAETQHRENLRLQGTLDAVQTQLADTETLKARIIELEEQVKNAETTLQQLADVQQEELSQLVAAYKATHEEDTIKLQQQEDAAQKASYALQAQLRVSEEECEKLKNALEALQLSREDVDKGRPAFNETVGNNCLLERDMKPFTTERVEKPSEGQDCQIKIIDNSYQGYLEQIALLESELQTIRHQFSTICSQLPEALEVVANGGPLGDLQEKGWPTAVENAVERLANAFARQRDEIEGRNMLTIENVREKCRKDHVELVEKLQSDFVKVAEERDRTAKEHSAVLEKVAIMKAALTPRLHAYQEENRQLRLETSSLMAENETLKKDLRVADSDHAAVRADLDKSQRELERLRTHLLEAHEAINHEALEREEEMLLLATRAERAEAELDEWKVLASQQKDEFAALDARRREFDEHLIRSREDLRDVVAAKEQAERELKNLQLVLEEFEMSKEAEIEEQLEIMKTNLEETTSSLCSFKSRAQEAERKLLSLETDHPRIRQLECEVREKNVQIGKLRHEAVLLNEDLAEAMRRMKNEMAEHSVDRRLITNLFVQFFNAPLGDRKRFDILELMASMLQFTEEEKEQVGLIAKRRASVAPGVCSPAGTSLPSSGEHVRIGESFSDKWISFLLSESSDRKGKEGI